MFAGAGTEPRLCRSRGRFIILLIHVGNHISIQEGFRKNTFSGRRRQENNAREFTDAMKKLEFTVQDAAGGNRLDQYISLEDADLSRSQVQQAIKNNRVLVNDLHQKASYRVCPGDVVGIELADPVPLDARPEEIPIDILFEDDWLVVVNKPPGMVVHPACGNYEGTLVNALLYHCTALSGIGGVMRPGIVHRLDKDTSGVLVVAKNDRAHQGLSEQFKEHSVLRKYKALVYGMMEDTSGTIEADIGRDRFDRKRMSTRTRKGRAAVTHWRVQEAFDGMSLLEVTLETGRTHQVRVHLASIGHPVVGDMVYGTAKKIRSIVLKPVEDALKKVKRQMLHAGYLSFSHPDTNKRLEFEAPVPDDYENILGIAREYLC